MQWSVVQCSNDEGEQPNLDRGRGDSGKEPSR
jgi:hypothetical protein